MARVLWFYLGKTSVLSILGLRGISPFLLYGCVYIDEFTVSTIVRFDLQDRRYHRFLQ